MAPGVLADVESAGTRKSSSCLADLEGGAPELASVNGHSEIGKHDGASNGIHERPVLVSDPRLQNGSMQRPPDSSASSPHQLNGRHETTRESHARIRTADSLSTAKEFGSVAQKKGDVLDMVCIGFGPASLAIAIALADAYSQSSRPLPNVLFLEKQEQFAWHSGMQLPSAKMQISFLKDLATPRDPTSPYSFINYLHSQGRFNQFVNMGTFLPTRIEYEDYMRWCAEHFVGVVRYGAEVQSVEPSEFNQITSRIRSFEVKWKDANGMEHGSATARNVVIAAGGEPYIPEEFKQFAINSNLWPGGPRVTHSSQYARAIKSIENASRKPSFLRCQKGPKQEEIVAAKSTILRDKPAYEAKILQMQTRPPSPIMIQRNQKSEAEKMPDLEAELSKAEDEDEELKASLRQRGLRAGPSRFVVVGSGQSAAEIFSDLWTRFPDAEVNLIIKDTALRPSDDSPFVNEIFDPERVDDIYHQLPSERKAAIDLDRNTNYGVVRLELLEYIYEMMYMQRIQHSNPLIWRCKIIPNRKVTSVEQIKADSSLLLRLTPARNADYIDKNVTEEIECDHVIVATGYVRNAHEQLLKGTRAILPVGQESEGFKVGRDYRVLYDEEKIERGTGVWLQGCNEKTHGLSDTLLSILAVRGGEVVESIFGDDLARADPEDGYGGTRAVATKPSI